MIRTLLLFAALTHSTSLAAQEFRIPEVEFRRLYELNAEACFDLPSDIELARAIQENDLSTMKLLLNGGNANVNAVGTGNVTMLAFSMTHQKYKRFKLLLDYGADPNTPFTYPSWSKGVDRRLFRDSGDTVLHVALGSVHTGYAEPALRHGADLWLAGSRQRPLTMSIFFVNPKIRMQFYRLFEQYGGDLSLSYKFDESALYHLITFESVDQAVELIKMGAAYDRPMGGYNCRHAMDVSVRSPVVFFDLIHSSYWLHRKRLIVLLDHLGYDVQDSLDHIRKEKRPMDDVLKCLHRTMEVELSPQEVADLQVDVQTREIPRPVRPKIDEPTFRRLYGMRANRFFDDPAVLRLCEAIERNDAAGIRDAVASGADVNAVGFAGTTPLWYAFAFQRHDRIATLLELGADPTARLSGLTGVCGFTRPKSTVLSEAAATSPIEIFSLLCDACQSLGIDWTTHRDCENVPIIHTILRGLDRDRLAKLQRYQADGGDLETTFETATTPLIHSVCLDQFESTLWLLDAGAEPHAKDDYGLVAADYFYHEMRNNAGIETYGSFKILSDQGMEKMIQRARPVLDRWVDLGYDWQVARKNFRALKDREQERDTEKARNKYERKPEDRVELGPTLPFRRQRQLRYGLIDFRFHWYPRQEFAGSGEFFDGDIHDHRRIHPVYRKRDYYTYD